MGLFNTKSTADAAPRQPSTAPAKGRIVLTYSSLVGYISLTVLFIQHVTTPGFVWDQVCTLWAVSTVSGFIGIFGPFLPVPIQLDGAPSDLPTPQAGGGTGQPMTIQADSVTKTPSAPDANQAGAPVRRQAARNQRGEFVGPQSSHSPGTTIGPQTTADAPVPHTFGSPPTYEGNG